MMSTTNPRTVGKQRIRSVTGVAVIGAVVGTGAMAFFVGHEFAGKTTAGAATPVSNSAQDSNPSTQAPSSGTQWGDDGQQFQNPYQGSPQYQSGSNGAQFQSPSGQAPQATTGGS